MFNSRQIRSGNRADHGHDPERPDSVRRLDGMSSFRRPRSVLLLAALPLLLACSLVSNSPISTATPPLPTEGRPPVGATAVPTGNSPYREISGEDLQGVIVPADRAAEFSIFKATGYWTPTDADVAAFDAAFPVWIAEQTEWGADEVSQRWPTDYTRQYVGFERDDQQLLYVNAFCAIEYLDWKNQPVMVDDGGPCFFSVVFNPATLEFTELMINGMA